MRLAAAVCAIGLVMSACDGSSPDDAGMDATTLDAGPPPGEPCADHAACVTLAGEEGHDRVHCIEGRCRARCDDAAQCAGHPSGPQCLRGSCGCEAEADCVGFPGACVASRCAQCVQDADCVFWPASRCDSVGRCVRCEIDADCPSGVTCEAGECVGPDDQDGDGFAADDCDDTDPRRFPGSLPTCGDGARQGCPGAWDSLATQLGVAEAGQHRLRSVLGPQPTETQMLSVSVVSVLAETYVALVYRAPPGPGGAEPRVARLLTVPFDAPTTEIGLALTDLDCGQTAPVNVEQVDRANLAVAVDGAVHLVVGGTVDGGGPLAHYLAHFVIADGAPSLVGCELGDDPASFGYASVGVAPDSGAVGGLLSGVTGSRDNVFQRFGAAPVTHFRSRDWLDGQGPVLATRSRPTAGGPITLHFGFDGALIDESVATIASAFDQGRGALAAASSGDYALVLPTAERTYLVEGRCAGSACAPAATPTDWDLALEELPAAHWVGADRYVLGFARYAQPEPGTNEAQVILRGLQRAGRPLPADLAEDAPRVVSRRSLPGSGALIVRDLDVSARADRIDVALIAQSAGGAPELFLRRVRLCPAE